MTGTEARLLQALREADVVYYDNAAVDRLLTYAAEEQAAALRSAAEDWPESRGPVRRLFDLAARAWLAARADRITATAGTPREGHDE